MSPHFTEEEAEVEYSSSVASQNTDVKCTGGWPGLTPKTAPRYLTHCGIFYVFGSPSGPRFQRLAWEEARAYTFLPLEIVKRLKTKRFSFHHLFPINSCFASTPLKPFLKSLLGVSRLLSCFCPHR